MLISQHCYLGSTLFGLEDWVGMEDTTGVAAKGTEGCMVPCAHVCMNCARIQTAASACILPFCLLTIGGWQVILALLYLLA